MLRTVYDAVLDTDVEEVRALLKQNPDAVHAMDEGATPLHFAAMGENTFLAEVLIRAGANVDAKALDERTPLHWAVLHGREEMAKTLIANGANIHAVDVNDGTALSIAVWNHHSHLAEYLRGLGARE